MTELKQPDISVVIVNYNVKDLVLVALSTLYKYADPELKLEVIVVDNNSSDDSLDEISTNFPEVLIIANKFNAGFPAANNQAFYIAKGRYIFMLNPDTEFLDGSINKMFHYMEEHADVSLLGPKLLNTDRSLQQSFWRFPRISYLIAETLYLRPLVRSKFYRDKDYSKPFEAESFSGAAILFRRAVFDQIGYLDESLFWIEEIDYCYRAVAAGLKLIYYPDAVIVHHVGQSAKKNYNISICNQVVNKIKFYKKYHPGIQWLFVVLLSLVHVLAKLIVFGILSPFKRIYLLKAKAYWNTLPRVFYPPTKMN